MNENLKEKRIEKLKEDIQTRKQVISFIQYAENSEGYKHLLKFYFLPLFTAYRTQLEDSEEHHITLRSQGAISLIKEINKVVANQQNLLERDLRSLKKEGDQM